MLYLQENVNISGADILQLMRQFKKMLKDRLEVTNAFARSNPI